ncbi:MAG TPA: chromate resistance protein ChrB domain-containing protein, partial [Halioglobus sp.]
MTYWLALITSLPTENATVRMRAWRALKASGAVVLRDGVYLMPERATCRAVLDTIAVDVRDGGGIAHVLRLEEPHNANFVSLFDRSEGYAALLSDVAQTHDALSSDTVQDTLKQARALRKGFSGLVETDFFPGESQHQAEMALRELELACARTLAPDEPHAIEGVIAGLNSADYQGRTWATRQRPWVDRLASAWLIRRFIDPQARFLWLEAPGHCPPDALGFDFDGATFSHVGSRVTFEVLLVS